ncbi:hypothetical protein [Desulfobacter postgatei]|uniref:hypothetical protein n=1 Tax=Desulfobacter postgatei TaxID=2293 RepID=UPI002A36B2D3|nr:hypothetical protein [Desulfobacter postgatei]MDX9964515.1 hypothetical protein [Desulfobacter postgatei]
MMPYTGIGTDIGQFSESVCCVFRCKGDVFQAAVDHGDHGMKRPGRIFLNF